MIVISDSSALISLSAAGCLGLLRDLYGEIVIPEAVRQEVVASGADRPGVREVAEASWIVVRSVRDRELLADVHVGLGPGESEAITLAVEWKADLIVLDENRARAKAARYNLKVIGVLGILIQAKRQGLIPTVAPLLQLLVEEAGFYIHPKYRGQALRAVGELADDGRDSDGD